MPLEKQKFSEGEAQTKDAKEKIEFGRAENVTAKGRILSHRLDNAPRDVSAPARWVDLWIINPKKAVGSIFDMGNSRFQGEEANAILDLVFGVDPVIDQNDFAIACLAWLNSGTHQGYQYKSLFEVLNHTYKCLIPEVMEWYIENIEILKKAFSYPESGYNRFIEMIEFLAKGKTLEEYTVWWMEESRKARRSRGESMPGEEK